MCVFCGPCWVIVLFLTCYAFLYAYLYRVSWCKMRLCELHKRVTEGSCKLSKFMLQQVWYLKLHEEGWDLHHIAWILDQTSKRNIHYGKNWTIMMCQNQQAHPINVITWLGLSWGTSKHNIPLRDDLSRLSASSQLGYSRVSHLNTTPLCSSLPPNIASSCKVVPTSMKYSESVCKPSDSGASTCEVQLCKQFLKIEMSGKFKGGENC